MSFIQAIESCFKNYFTFTGRAPRSEYIYWILFLGLFGFVSGIVLGIATGDESIIDTFSTLITLILLPAGISVIIRRFHDIGKSGWNWFWILTIIGAFVVIYWLVFLKGDQGDNQYGQNPIISNGSRYKQSNNPQSINTSTQSPSTLSYDDEKKPKAKNESGSYKKGGLYD